MRRLFIALITPLFFCSTVVADTKTDRERDGLRGPVRTVVTEMAQLSNQGGKWTEESRVGVESSTYDAKGNLVEKISYHADGAPAQRSVRTYDATGKLTTEVLSNPGGSLWRTSTYVYNAAGQMSETIHSDTDGALIFKDLCTYDAAGNLTQMLSLDSTGVLLRKAVSTCNAKGELMEKAYYDATDKVPTSKNTYAYNANGNVTEMLTYGRGGALSSKAVYSYDDKGNQTERIEYRPNGSVALKQVYTYEFDAQENWIKKTVSELITDGDKSALEPSEVSYRTITYYASSAP